MPFDGDTNSPQSTMDNEMKRGYKLKSVATVASYLFLLCGIIRKLILLVTYTFMASNTGLLLDLCIT